jgi:hypothetical protein
MLGRSKCRRLAKGNLAFVDGIPNNQVFVGLTRQCAQIPYGGGYWSDKRLANVRDRTTDDSMDFGSGSDALAKKCSGPYNISQRVLI